MLAHPSGERSIVEVVVLHKGDGGLRGFNGLALVLYHHLMTCAIFHLYVFAHHNVGAQIHGETHHESQSHLSHNLEFAFQAILVVSRQFQIVVGETEAAEPDGGEEHEEHIHIA